MGYSSASEERDSSATDSDETESQASDKTEVNPEAEHVGDAPAIEHLPSVSGLQGGRNVQKAGRTVWVMLEDEEPRKPETEVAAPKKISKPATSTATKEKQNPVIQKD